MTYEELEKARKEKTWLVCQGGKYQDKRLVQLVDASLVESVEREYALVAGPNYPRYWVRSSRLRIATPNDMLKYGE